MYVCARGITGNAVEGEEDTRLSRPEANRQQAVVKLCVQKVLRLRNAETFSKLCSGEGSEESEEIRDPRGNRASVGGVVHTSYAAKPRT